MKPRKGQKIWRFLQKNPKAWTQGAMAKNRKGESVSSNNPKAVAWCALGLIDRFYSDSRRPANKHIVQCVERRLRRIIGLWNDSPKRTVQQVIAAFKKLGL